MSNVNKVILVGNLGGDPELRFTAKGTAVTNISLATSRFIQNAEGDRRQDTHWHRAVLWGKRAETCAKYLKKGSRVYLEGLLQPRQWVDKEGNSHRSSEILVEEIKFLGSNTFEKQSEYTPTNVDESRTISIN
jgi:single-strand DNA-binding protein